MHPRSLIPFAIGSLIMLAACTPQTPVANVALSPTEATLTCLGDTLQVSVDALDSAANSVPGVTFAWSTSDAGVVTVEDGQLTAVGAGEAIVTATVRGMTGEVRVEVAPVIDFACANALDGWELTGDWRLYDAAPESCIFESVAFPAPALGTNGNRVTGSDACDEEVEDSSALSPQGVLPETLEFLSWNVDEVTDVDPYFLDARTVVFRPAVGEDVVLVDCQADAWLDVPPCEYMNDPREGDAWDQVSIATGELAGQVGRLLFTYDTADSCCHSEQGWFIRDLNFRVR